MTCGGDTCSGQTRSIDDTGVMTEQARVRTDSVAVRSLLNAVVRESPTFAALVGRVNATNGLVYVHDATCPGALKACLFQRIEIAGPNRILRIGVRFRGRDSLDIAASIGHELQHALELLEKPWVATEADMLAVWATGTRFTNERFETVEALETGSRIAYELRGMKNTR